MRTHPGKKRKYLKIGIFIFLGCLLQGQSFRLTQVITVPSSSIVSGNGLVIVKWSGGNPPFQVQSTTNLVRPWRDVGGVTYGYSITNILVAPLALYRVTSVGGIIATSLDKTAPTVPANLTASTVGNNEVDLTWNASVDSGANATGVKAYNIYRDGVFLLQVAASNTFAADIYVHPSTTNTYAVSAVDNAYNESALSAAASAATPGNSPPTVSLTVPANGSVVSNTITLSATAADNAGVTKVEFYRDSGTLLGTDTTTPYNMNFDTTTTTNGAHSFYAKVYDAANNSAASATSAVTVSNVTGVTNLPGQLKWVKTMATPNGYNAEGNSVAADASGNVIVAGDFNNGVDLGGGVILIGSAGLFITKYTSSGGVVWTKALAAGQSSLVKSVAVDSQNNIIVAGSFAGTVDFGGVVVTALNFSSMFVAKYSPSGSLLWVRSYGGVILDYDMGMGMAVDGSDNVVMLGRFESANVNFGSGIILSAPGTSSLVLVKLSSSGTTLWAKTYGTGEVMPQSMTIDRSNNVEVTGQVAGSSDLGGGTMTSANLGTYSTFVAKYSGANGSYSWARVFGGSSIDSGFGITADPTTGNVVVTGGFEGAANFGGGSVSSVGGGLYLVGYDPSGNFLWVQTYGTSAAGSSCGNAVKIDASGNLVLTASKGNGWFLGGSWNFTSGFVVQAYSISGNTAPVLRWYKLPGSGSTAGSTGNGITLDSFGHVLATGSFSFGTIDFGGILGTTTANSKYGFLAQYAK